MTPSRLNTLSLAGWATLVWGLPFSHAAMSMGTAWLGVLALWALCTSSKARHNLTSASSWRPMLCLTALLGWSTLSMVWTSDVSWGWRALGLQWPILVLMLAWPALDMSELDRSKVQGWVFGSAGLAMVVCLAWGGWHLSQGEVLEGREDVRIVGDRFVFQSEVLFAQGQASIGPQGQQQLTELAAALNQIAAEIPDDIDWVLQVEGHTDDIPVRAGRFADNWDLSTERALSVVRFLSAKGLEARRLAAAGYGEFQPLDNAGTDTARRRNRRIEMKLTQRISGSN